MNQINISKEKDATIQTYFKAVFETRDLGKVYDEYATEYDGINAVIEYQAYTQVANEIVNWFSEAEISSKLILDVGSGTGLCGQSLAAKGFTRIHALDLSQASLDEARKKNVYEDYFCRGVTNKPTPGIKDNTYDATVSSGCFIPSHFKMDALEEMSRITKPGGYIVITICDPMFVMGYMEGLNRVMMTGKVELQSMKLVPYRRQPSENYQQKFGYVVVLKVL